LTERLRPSDWLGLTAALVLALGGLAGFILIFVRHMNVYWFILSPIILAVYEIPAVTVYGTWKKRRERNHRPRDEESQISAGNSEIACEEGVPERPSGDVQP